MSRRAREKLIQVALCIAAWIPAYLNAADCEGKCVLAIGNSITFSGPDYKIGWAGNWGMAATAAENDYVSQFLILLKDRSKSDVWMANRQSGYLLEKDPAQFKLTDSLIRQSKRANIVIVELGDNFVPNSTNTDEFSKKYLELLKSVRPLNGALACVSTFWTSQVKNKIIEDSCHRAGGTYVDISGLSDSPENIAGNQQTIVHKGVAGHPGDIGMRAIAQRIFNSMRL